MGQVTNIPGDVQFYADMGAHQSSRRSFTENEFVVSSAELEKQPGTTADAIQKHILNIANSPASWAVSQSTRGKKKSAPDRLRIRVLFPDPAFDKKNGIGHKAFQAIYRDVMGRFGQTDRFGSGHADGGLVVRIAHPGAPEIFALVSKQD